MRMLVQAWHGHLAPSYCNVFSFVVAVTARLMLSDPLQATDTCQIFQITTFCGPGPLQGIIIERFMVSL